MKRLSIVTLPTLLPIAGRLRRVLTALVLLSVVTACESSAGGTTWTQFHGGDTNNGFQPVRKNLLSTPEWTVEVGPVGFGSPVVATDGSIYLAAVDALVAVNPTGTIRWQRSVDADKFLSSASVGSLSRLYVVSTRQDDSAVFGVRSTLHAFSLSGARLWSFDLPDEGFTLASPKIWSDGSTEYVFLYALVNKPAGALRGQGALFILDQDGNLLHTETGTCNFTLGGGVGAGEFFESLWDDFVDLLGTDFDRTVPGSNIFEWYQLLGPRQSTVAIQTDQPASPGAPIIVVADRFCTVRAYTWNPPTLGLLWEQTHTLIEQSSPAVSGNLVILGGRDGVVRAYDLISGNPLWEYQAERSEDRFSFLATPAYFISPIYAVDLTGHIHAMNQNGQLWRTQESGGFTDGSPALTRNMLYLLTTSGFHAFASDLTPYFDDPSLRSGESSPAVGPDGAVYAAGWSDSVGVLRKYPAIAVGIPTP